MAENPNQPLTSSCAFSWAAASHTGKVREENEDAFAVEPELGLLVVSDGMGGHRGGALASKIIVEDLPPVIENCLDGLRSRSPRAVRRMLKKVIAEQSRQLLVEGTSESGYKDMGATVVVALLVDERIYVANLGDSRIYRLRNGRLSQLTKDHSVVSELLERGHIEPEDAEEHDAQGQITHYIGMEADAHPHVRSLAAQKADRLLLCTDGLTDLVDDRRIVRILRTNFDCQAACDTLVKAANSAGGTDNVTVVVADLSS
jgi:protein phosphatase